MGRRGKPQYSKDPYPQVGNQQIGRYSQWQMFSLQSEGSELGLSSPGVLWDHETPEYLAFEGHQGLYVGELEAIGNRDFTLKELT